MDLSQIFKCFTNSFFVNHQFLKQEALNTLIDHQTTCSAFNFCHLHLSKYLPLVHKFHEAPKSSISGAVEFLLLSSTSHPVKSSFSSVLSGRSQSIRFLANALIMLLLTTAMSFASDAFLDNSTLSLLPCQNKPQDPFDISPPRYPANCQTKQSDKNIQTYTKPNSKICYTVGQACSTDRECTPV